MLLTLNTFCIQIIEILQDDLNLDIDNVVDRLLRYNSDSIISFSLSFNMKTLLPDILTFLQNVLETNETNIIPTGFNLTKQGFQLLTFQPSCK